MAAAAPKDEAPKALVEHPNIYAALAAFQAEVPLFKKDSTASVKSDKGSYSYGYAGLDVLVEKVVPLLGRQGIAWVAIPTLDENGRSILRYGLYHGASNTSVEGVYPLPSGTPQQVGSAITYARRYGLLSMTGTFPADEDDDGQAAAHSYSNQRAQATGPRTFESGDGEPSGPPRANVTHSQIDAAQSLEELRDIYRKASPNGGLDGVLDTGEVVRDAITAKRMSLTEAEEKASAEPTAAEVAEALGSIGQEVADGDDGE